MAHLLQGESFSVALSSNWLPEIVNLERCRNLQCNQFVPENNFRTMHVICDYWEQFPLLTCWFVRNLVFAS